MTDAVDHLARLAGIDLGPDERQRLSRHLESLQRLIDALPTGTAEAGLLHVVALALRPDEAGDPMAPDQVMALLNSRRGTWLDLPPVREDEP